MKKVMNKKGLSTIVATLLILLLVFVAIGIVWVVTRNTVKQGTDQIELNTKCLAVDMNVQAASCVSDTNISTDLCEVTFSRGSDSSEIAGVKLVFSNDDGESNYIESVVGNIEPLESKKVSNISTGLVDVSSVQIVVFFEDSSGKEQLCSSLETYEI